MDVPSGDHPFAGLGSAVVVLGLWAVTLGWSLTLDVSQLPLYGLIPLILLRIFVHTGLFITAHDAMHGSVYRPNRRLNDAIGTLAVGCYALLAYRPLCEKHWAHHRNPATAEDPDFYPGDHRSWGPWYLQFMRSYLTGTNNWLMVIGINGLFYGLWWSGWVPVANLLLFWLGPLVLSSMQLFYFGIFLPHRRPTGGYTNRHRAMSNGFAPIWSFLSCYHFGYHWEHHEYPHLPWYRLVGVRRSVS